jgi:hypothetical protein
MPSGDESSIELGGRIGVGSVLDSRTWVIEYSLNVLRLRLIPPQDSPSSPSAGSRIAIEILKGRGILRGGCF